MKKTSPAISEQVIREVAVAAFADVRTVRRVLRGEQVRGLVADRIHRELAARHTRQPKIQPR